jgi:50S ribosomal protein L16 3-hydroxylase
VPASTIVSQLFAPLTVEKFIDDYWPDNPYIQHGSIDRLKRLRGIPELFDIDAFAKTRKREITVWCSNKKNVGFYNRVHLKQCRADVALDLYEAGATLYVTDADRDIYALREITREIEADLGLAPGSVRCELFFSRKGSGTPYHFDHDINFNLQLKGRKKWIIAPNRNAPFPLTHFKIIEGAPTGELSSYWRGPVPKKPAAGKKTFWAKPGSFVFLPQGYWHTTVALQDSIAMSFVVVPPAWIDLLMRTIRRNLVQVETWRKRAIPSFNKEEHLDELREMISKTTAGLQKLTLEDLMAVSGVHTGEVFALRKNVLLRLLKKGKKDRSKLLLSVKERKKEASSIEFNAAFSPLFEWIMNTKGTFTMNDALSNAGVVQIGGVERILEVLVSVGALTRFPAAHSVTGGL